MLNPVIQPSDVARLVPLVSYGLIEIVETRGVRPDVAVWQTNSSIANVYERGGYASIINYGQPPLTKSQSAFVQRLFTKDKTE